tara:strand:+ start:83 stop:451 length:369 start_codon:yes stop_codon:yes gene_type:complete
MTTLEKFQEVANIKFIHSNRFSLADIEIGKLNTADGYELFYITQDVQNLQFDNEVYYYKPNFDTVMSEIRNAYTRNEVVNVACFDIDESFDEYDMLNWLESEMDEEAFEEFTNNVPGTISSL